MTYRRFLAREQDLLYRNVSVCLYCPISGSFHSAKEILSSQDDAGASPILFSRLSKICPVALHARLARLAIEIQQRAHTRRKGRASRSRGKLLAVGFPHFLPYSSLLIYPRSMHAQMKSRLKAADAPSPPTSSSSYLPSSSYSYSHSKLSSPAPPPTYSPSKSLPDDPVTYTRIMHAHTLTQLNCLEGAKATRTAKSESNTPVMAAVTSRLEATQRLVVTDMDRLDLNHESAVDDEEMVDEADADAATPCDPPFPGKKVLRRTTVASCARPKSLVAVADAVGRGTVLSVVRRDWAVASGT